MSKESRSVDKIDEAQLPRIIACGYREIKSSKTSLTFPAWLVQFEDQKFWWRSKRDFLLLFRASKRSIPIPKASLQKLANQSPWKIPNTEISIQKIDSKAEINNYSVQMVKSVQQCNYFIRKLASCCEDERVLKAWQNFSRSSDTDGLLDSGSMHNSDNCLPEQVGGQTSHEEAARLGQYFCSPTTAEKLVQLTTEFCLKRSIFNSKSLHKLTFLEPSCGQGDILWNLLQNLKTNGYDPGCYRVIACDIDHNAIQSCQEYAMQNKYVVNDWLRSDFLATKNDADYSGHVVVLGGPPYTSGAGSGKNMERNLPDLFFKHCVETWNAVFVAFILPKRYHCNPINTEEGWRVETHRLESSSFFFQGNQKITQPSIIQCYIKGP